MSLFLIAALPFLGAVLPALLVRASRNAAAGTAAGATALALIGVLTHAPAVMRGEVPMARAPWVPSLGLNANLMLDGLGLLFALLILGIGLLIILYARFYLTRRDPMGKFYALLLLFQGAMLGIVLSDNILMLLIFWELTSLSSFLLIGYWNHLPEGRQGARMALTVTGAGGLAMIAGALLLGQAAGSMELSDIIARREAVQASELYLPALILILAGCFAKSAQFPFHFWLPHAMAAPTPVSAYLHSATMVKAGLFLMARLWPALAGTDAWFLLAASVGLITMVLGAVTALFKDDLKGLLAYSTVSHLGLVTFLLGLGTPAGAVAAVFHIINHATFKAALFMTAGIVDHETGTRDIRRLGGLAAFMPVTFLIGAVAALSMAGVPPLNGFLSKEMMLHEAAHTAWLGSELALPVLAGLAALFSAAYSFRFVAHVFLGKPRLAHAEPPHDPVVWFWLPPAILASLTVLIGLFPQSMAGELVRAAAGAVTAGAAPEIKLKLWHGVNEALMISAAALAGGAAALALHGPLARVWAVVAPPAAKRAFDALVGAATAAARRLTDALHDGDFGRSAAIFSVFAAGLGAWAWTAGGAAPLGAFPAALGPTPPIPLIGWVCLVTATLTLTALHRHRLLALVLIGVTGLMVSLTFSYFSAPDLALTQISVEVVSIILLLLALNFMPRETPRESSAARRARDLAAAAAAGLGVGAAIYAILVGDFAFAPISEFHLANSKTGGGGENVVNVILVDFRGFDTFGEITVLGIAAVLIYALTETIMAGPVRARLLNRRPAEPQAGDAHPMMMVVATRVLMPIALTVAVYIFLRGHNAPGGGFIAGLIVSVAFVMQYMASGFSWAAARQRYPYHAFIGLGVLVAAATGMGAWFNGKPFLTSDFGYVKLPGLEKFELATAALFDLGVFLTVLGAVLLALESLARYAWRPNIASAHPMDIDPTRDEAAQREEGR
ncbi:monovalent cation/H+ antiporter subunit A [Oceanicella actignis]|uniref:monovalent cation/H+ antiporter subunit A n=1 Tax=Oceanicella actignis TaxID=1189325 RepID=UPI0011E84000|nr:monovalent cation/H+ antiporter subunit A [Oceanicella actignis]TYO91192.1 multicomponent K+:H+ antiporter subunit A [Oceanicella actignis]